MGFKLAVKPIVIFDIEEAVDYYENKVVGLGNRFFNQLLSSLINIQSKPFTCQYVKSPVRRCKIIKFPYKIFYYINAETIFILGVAHAKRSNAFIRKRLKLL